MALFKVTQVKVLSLLMIITAFACLYIQHYDPKFKIMHYLTERMEALRNITNQGGQFREQFKDNTTKIIHLWGQIRQKFFNFTGCPYKCEFIKDMEYQKEADLVLISVHPMP